MRFKAAHRILISVLFLLGASFTARAEAINIVAFGDSLMAGYELPPESAFPAQLEAALKEKGYDVAVSNASVSGDTTTGGLSRLDWSIPDGTDGVILGLGSNDALRGLSPTETEQNLEAMVARLKERGIAVLLAGTRAPPSMGADYAKRFDDIYPTLAEDENLTFFPVFVEPYILDAGLKLSDGMHPNAKGVDAVVQAFLPTMEAFIEKVQGQ